MVIKKVHCTKILYCIYCMALRKPQPTTNLNLIVKIAKDILENDLLSKREALLNILYTA